MDMSVAVLSQVFKSPHLLVSSEASLQFAVSMQPSENPTDVNPPGWSERDERWTIDTLLGLYDPQERKIIIFTKGIEHTANQLGLVQEFVEHVVRIHEWAHAIVHLGVNQNISAELAKAYLNDDGVLERTTSNRLTHTYKSIDLHVHEQMAQVITFLAIKSLNANATIDGAKQACTSLLKTFETITQRQPPQYKLDHFQQLELGRLRNRLRAIIGLIRDGGVCGNRQNWDTVMTW